jgi:hypothetical protein
MPDTFGGLVLFRVLFASHPRFLTVSTSHLLIVEALLFLSGIENKKEKKERNKRRRGEEKGEGILRYGAALKVKIRAPIR